MNRIADTTSFGGHNLLDGSFGEKSFQIGANSNETQSLGLMDVSAHAIGREHKKLEGDQQMFLLLVVLLLKMVHLQ